VIITIVILSIVVISLGYSTLNLLKTLEKHEESIEQSDEWIVQTKTELDKILTDIQAIDNREIFEKDDEVGQTFMLIRKTIKRLENL